MNKNGRSASSANRKHVANKRGQLSKIQFANVIENINEGFLALDAQMNYTYINQRWKVRKIPCLTLKGWTKANLTASAKKAREKLQYSRSKMSPAKAKDMQ